MSNQNSNVPFFAGLVIGGVVGAGVALMLAPHSGEETRSQIRDKSLGLRGEAVEGLTDAGQHAQTQVEAWQEKGQKVAKAVSQSKDSIIQAVNQSKDRVVEAVSSSK
jgi:gas vesicle protein